MADDDNGGIAIQAAWLEMQLMLGQIIEIVALLLRPQHEGTLIGRPKGVSVVAAVAVEPRPFICWIAWLPEHWRREGMGLARRLRRFAQEPAAERALGRQDRRGDLMAGVITDAAVVIGAAPVVIGDERAGGQQQRHPAALAGWLAQDEEGV